MFGNKRKLVISVDKRDKEQSDEDKAKNFEAKADYVLHKLEKVGTNVFVGFCVYILLDTYRQVTVIKSIYPPQADE
jgi:hypothetical protein